MMNTTMTTTTPSNPLETLVVQQLAHLIQDEQLLATKYPVLTSQADSSEIREEFSCGLAELRRRADRLQRFVDALDNFGLATSSRALAS